MQPAHPPEAKQQAITGLEKEWGGNPLRRQYLASFSLSDIRNITKKAKAMLEYAQSQGEKSENISIGLLCKLENNRLGTGKNTAELTQFLIDNQTDDNQVALDYNTAKKAEIISILEYLLDHAPRENDVTSIAHNALSNGPNFGPATLVLMANLSSYLDTFLVQKKNIAKDYQSSVGLGSDQNILEETKAIGRFPRAK